VQQIPRRRFLSRWLYTGTLRNGKFKALKSPGVIGLARYEAAPETAAWFAPMAGGANRTTIDPIIRYLAGLGGRFAKRI